MPVPRLLTLACAALAVTLVAASCGDDDDVASSTADDLRTVEIEMQDIAFSPTTIDVGVGETVKFVFTNSGEVAHEAYLGDPAAQAEHADEMSTMGGMDHGDDDVLVVEPGQRGEMTHTFDEAGTTQIGCHEPGHFEAGMVLDVEVG